MGSSRRAFLGYAAGALATFTAATGDLDTPSTAGRIEELEKSVSMEESLDSAAEHLEEASGTAEGYLERVAEYFGLGAEPSCEPVAQPHTLDQPGSNIGSTDFNPDNPECLYLED